MNRSVSAKPVVPPRIRPTAKPGVGLSVFVLLVLFVVLLSAGPALAHADLVSSEFQGTTARAGVPQELLFRFSADLEPAFSRAQILDAQGRVVDPGPGEVDAAEPRMLRIAVGQLPDGSYTAALRVRAGDGHFTEFSVPFAIGSTGSEVIGLPPLGTGDPALQSPPAVETVIRWVELIGAALSVGGVFFGILVWRPAWQAGRKMRARSGSGDADGDADDAVTRLLRRLVLVGALVVLVAASLLLLNQAAVAQKTSWFGALGGPLGKALGAHTGRVWMARSAFALLLALVALALPAPPPGGTVWWGAAALSAGMLATFSLGGHAVEVSGQAELTALLDWVHGLAAMVWLGGLVALALALGVVRRPPEARSLVAPMATRFSSVALVCVAYLGVSGLYGYSRQVAGVRPLIDTAYGRVLILKLCLFGVLVLFGALNRFYLLPRLVDPADTVADHAIRRFGRSLRLETAVGALVLLTVGALTSLGPAAGAYAAQQRMGPAQAAGVGKVGLVLRLAPGQIGDNFLAVDVADHRAGAELVPGKVTVRLAGSPDETTLPPSLRKGGLERYATEGYPLPRAGALSFDVTLNRQGFNPIEHVFTLDVGTK